MRKLGISTFLVPLVLSLTASEAAQEPEGIEFPVLATAQGASRPSIWMRA